MKTKFFTTIIVQFIFFSIINAQVTQEWVARYNSSSDRLDYATAMAIDVSENVYITGYSAAKNASYYNGDYLTVKYNSSGVEQWAKTYNGISDSLDKAVEFTWL